VTAFALRPRRKGETTVVDEIVEQAAETANGLLVPEGLDGETWQAIGGIQRFYLRMLDMETTGASKLDNYQNFAKAFRVQDYAAVMASIKPNAARLKAIMEFKPRDLTDRTEIGPTPLGALIITIQEFLADRGARSADGEPARRSGGLPAPAPGANGHGRLCRRQGPRSRDPPRCRGDR
jgi:putative DNA methylase